MSQQLIDGILAAIPMPAVLVDHSEFIIGANSEGEKLLGVQLFGRHFATVLRQPGVTDAVETCLKNQKPCSTRHLSNDGAQDTTFEVTLRYVPETEAFLGGAVLLTFVDVSEREQAGQVRRDFVANVSHELRTPLTALMGFIETLLGAAKDDPNARERFLEIMKAEAGRMNRLVGDLMTLNHVESQERMRPETQVNLSEILAVTLHSLEPLANSGGVEMVLDIGDNPVILFGDPDQLKQVFANLIENAIKYGGDQVCVELIAGQRDPVLRCDVAKVNVIDNGDGIDPVHLPRLTERFYRADSHRSRSLGGTGLGLAIVKHITSRHRGRFRVDSELGAGSNFCVTLPLQK